MNTDLESLENSKIVFQVNNHFGTFLYYGLDNAVEIRPMLAKGCLAVASKASQHHTTACMIFPEYSVVTIT